MKVKFKRLAKEYEKLKEPWVFSAKMKTIYPKRNLLPTQVIPVAFRRVNHSFLYFRLRDK